MNGRLLSAPNSSTAYSSGEDGSSAPVPAGGTSNNGSRATPMTTLSVKRPKTKDEILAGLMDANTERIDMHPMLVIHRGQDSYIGFLRKHNGRFENLFSLQVSALQRMIPSLAHWLVRDSHFTVNSAYRSAFWANGQTGLPDVSRKERDLRYLNACYVDLDCGRPESPDPRQRMTWLECYGELAQRIENAQLLQPSMIARSGRGLYLLWLLKADTDPVLPPRAFSSKIALYKQINRAIGLRLEELAADLGAHDAARVLRVPGTVHGETGQQAKYHIILDQAAQPFIYTLQHVATSFGVKVIGTRPHPEAAEVLSTRKALRFTAPEKRHTTPKRRAGYQKRFEKLAEDILAICQHQGGWKKGFRRMKLSLYASALLRSGLTCEQAVQAVAQMGAGCSPPYPTEGEANDESAADLVRTVQDTPKRILSSQRLISIFGVTPELAVEYELQYLLPDEVLESRRGPTKKEQIAQRREYVREWCEYHHKIPSLRAMVAVLSHVGIAVGKDTVRSDYKALGLNS